MMKKNTELLKWAGAVFLAGVVVSLVGNNLESGGRGDLAGAWFAFGFVLISLTLVLLLMGAVNYFRAPRNTQPVWIEGVTPSVKIKNQRKPVSNWRRVIAWLAAVPSALIGLGWLVVHNVLPKLPKGPADHEFLQVSFMHFLAVVIIGKITYHVVLAIDIPRIIEWLKEKH